jgi:hypothetical protein
MQQQHVEALYCFASERPAVPVLPIAAATFPLLLLLLLLLLAWCPRRQQRVCVCARL